MFHQIIKHFSFFAKALFFTGITALGVVIVSKPSTEPTYKAEEKEEKAKTKAAKKKKGREDQDEDRRKRLYVLSFDGDIKASAADKASPGSARVACGSTYCASCRPSTDRATAARCRPISARTEAVRGTASSLLS